MKQKSGVALVSMISFILLCSGIFAGDENVTSTSEYEDYVELESDEDFMVEIQYETGDKFYHIIAKWRTYTLRNKDSSEPDIVYVSFLSVPESSNNFRIFIEGLEDKEIEPIVITSEKELIDAKKSINEQLKNNKELIEFIMKYWGGSEEEIKNNIALDDEYIKDLTEALEKGYGLCGFIYPEFLYEKEEFILRIDFDWEFNETQKNKFYANWLKGWTIRTTEIKNFDHIYFILPEDAYPWWYGNSDYSSKEKGRHVFRWDVQQNEIIEMNATFGTLEERLHWENYVSDIRNFIYVIIGLFLAITMPIMLTRFRRYPRTKYIILILAFVILGILYFKRIDTFNLEKIPLEDPSIKEHLIGESLNKEINLVFIALSAIFIAFLTISHFCIDRRGREENPEQKGIGDTKKNENNKEKKSKKISNKDKIKIKLKEYELILRRMDQEANVSWSRFSVFLAVNTLLIYLFIREDLFTSLACLYFLVGISINVLWLFVHLKSLKMMSFYNKMLKYMEKKEFDKNLDFMRKYNELFYEKYETEIGKDTIRAKWFQRRSITELMLLFPILFILIDIIILIIL